MRLSILFILLLFAGIFLLISCTDFKRDNPYDPDGINYVGDQSSSSSSSSVPSSSSVALPPSSSSSKPSSSSAGSVPSGGKGNNISAYKTKIIGTQTWMAENLNYAASGSKCGGDDGKLKDDNTSYCDTYGRLYNWATAMALDASCGPNSCASQINPKHQGICPEGWHIPNDDDWNKLVNFVESGNSCSNCAASYLKATSGWNSGGNGQDTYGFSALPGSYGYSGDSFGGVGGNGYWWSATESSGGGAYYRYMDYRYERVFWNVVNKSYLHSVRCVKD
ncbi:MAG: fibrobacter succinogenes major paralogous domain-containing protein [Fibromonadaceae bacterium]|jgi:uncharacterized protein (TIGR02145 family)|nr:fibrobacter succinogenes major paralogous domain-containing protein [Fibromonadaceae bacterium]